MPPDKPVSNGEFHADQVRQDDLGEHRAAEGEERSDAQDAVADARHVAIGEEMQRQDDTSDDRYSELKGKYNHQRLVSGLVVFIVMVGAAFVGNFSKKANDTAEGAAQFSCLLVSALEAQADTEAAIVIRLPPGQARDDHVKSLEQDNELAAKGRSFVKCPPRVHTPTLKKP